MKKYKLTREKIIEIIVILVLTCVYIIPTGIIETKYQVSKIIFTFPIILLYIFSIKKITQKEVLFIISIVLMILCTRDIKYIMFITIPFLDRIIEHKENIKEYLRKSNILYICLIFTLIYSVIFWGTGGRYAFTAIKEINQSGLAIFCLGIMLLAKNKKVGIFTLLFGMLTVSRSYYLALVVYILSKSKFIKKYCIKEYLVKFCNYTTLTIISSILLVLAGIFYIQQYKTGNIFWGDELSTRLYSFLDYSNFFRFATIIVTVLIFIKFPNKLFSGVTTEEYINIGKTISQEIGIPYKYVMPHNLFYSHFKMYGIFAIVETVYVSIILKKIVNKENFLLYIAIILYSVILGAGLYSYWLYLSFFTLILNDGDKRENENIND